MAVQAQYPATVFRGNHINNNNNNVMEEYYFQQLQSRENIITNGYNNVLGVTNNNYGQKMLMNGMNGAVLSDPESELTCNVSASRKRNRDDTTTTTTTDHHLHLHQIMPPSHQSYHIHSNLQQQQQQQVLQNLRYAKLQKCQGLNSTTTSTAAAGTLSYEESRLHESGVTSTSGRSSSSIVNPSSLVSPLATTHNQDLNSHLLVNQNIEIDALVLLHNEKLRSVLEETRKRHCRSLLSAVEQQVLKRLEEKEIELQNASRKNAELEEKIKQISAENQIWFNVAKNNEAIVSSLKSTLEQILVQNNNNNNTKGVQALTKEEGYGDSEGIVLNGLAGGQGADHDAQSCCYEGAEAAAEDRTVSRSVADYQRTVQENIELKQRKLCKVCCENEVSVLLLPCRHLCLCKDCESKLDLCPICNSMKNASLQIFMS